MENESGAQEARREANSKDYLAGALRNEEVGYCIDWKATAFKIEAALYEEIVLEKSVSEGLRQEIAELNAALEEIKERGNSL